ncbi:MAG: hypothetical protein KGL39_38500 [Patescibacteria group bacterium]|nr:hypothetical protein [Patescibacteria group bacterium]
MTSGEKVIEVERQVRAMIAGEQEPKFTCPFCAMVSVDGQFLCCPEAAEVISAVLDHIEHLGRCEVIERTMDHFEAMKAKAALN